MDLKELQARLPAYQPDSKGLQFLANLNTGLKPLEQELERSTVVSDLPIIFIGGLQRSGTTLMYQLLARYLDVGYVNNLWARFWQTPLVGARLAATLAEYFHPEKLDLQSEYGTTGDLSGPHEFGYFWSERLGLGNIHSHVVSDAEATLVNWPELARCVLQMATICGRPLVFKNPVACFSTYRLAPHIPKFGMVFTRRDLFFVAQSTYLARIKRYGSPAQWWSLKPIEYETIIQDPDPFRQVAAQVLSIERFNEGLIERFPQFASSVDYQDLRRFPADVLDRIARKYGIPIRQLPSLGPNDLPDGDKVRLDSTDERRMRSALEEVRAEMIDYQRDGSRGN